MGLEEIWKEKKPECLVGSMDDFMEFLGTDSAALQKMTYLDLPALPGIRNKAIDRGSSRDSVSDLIVWQWQWLEKTIVGRGETLFDAALEGLFICWVLSVNQKKKEV